MALAAAAGCREYVNPWEDATLPAEVVTTASVSAANRQSYEPALRQRGYATVGIAAQDGSVRHFPLWFEDPFEDRGSDDGRFAWTAEDYIAAPYGLARMILNGICVPVSAVVQPPVPDAVSDGVTSRQALGFDHDPEWHPDGVSTIPPDILELGANGANHQGSPDAVDPGKSSI